MTRLRRSVVQTTGSKTLGGYGLDAGSRQGTTGYREASPKPDNNKLGPANPRDPTERTPTSTKKSRRLRAAEKKGLLVRVKLPVRPPKVKLGRQGETWTWACSTCGDFKSGYKTKQTAQQRASQHDCSRKSGSKRRKRRGRST